MNELLFRLIGLLKKMVVAMARDLGKKAWPKNKRDGDHYL